MVQKDEKEKLNIWLYLLLSFLASFYRLIVVSFIFFETIFFSFSFFFFRNYSNAWEFQQLFFFFCFVFYCKQFEIQKITLIDNSLVSCVCSRNCPTRLIVSSVWNFTLAAFLKFIGIYFWCIFLGFFGFFFNFGKLFLYFVCVCVCVCVGFNCYCWML